ncbi:MAG: hypothetical protein WC496_11660 [Phycisphaerae bacterium]|jgi:Tfp pilus assembly protein PilO
MDLGLDKEKIMRYKALFERHLGSPVKMRLATMGGLLVLTIVLVYMPLSKEIKKSKKLLSSEKERNSCIMEHEKLQKQVEIFHSIIGEKSDTNEWVQYLLDGMRKFPVKLKGMESKQQRKVGPYRAAALSMEIEGTFAELKKYVEWVESSPRLVRIDTLQIEQRSSGLLLKILVLGIVPK